MKTCQSKYHVGERLVEESSFASTSTNRCTQCVAKTYTTYQQSNQGKRTNQAHYQQNVDQYKTTQRNSHERTIARDGGIKYLFQTARRRAKREKLEFSISQQDISMPVVCPVYGIPLAFTEARTPNTPSLDRVDNNLGYVPGNVRVISWKANHKKRDLSVEDIDKLYEYMTGKL